MKIGADEGSRGPRPWLGRGLLCLSLVVPQPGCSMREEAERVEERDLSSETSAILNGNPADAGEYPWMAQIVVPGYTQWCGGSVLNRKWVLTAAHCLRWIPDENFTVRAGVHVSSAPDGAVQTRGVLRYIIHPDFNPSVLENDLALIELSEPLTYTSRVQPIALAETDAPVGTEARISGWGDTVTNGESSDVLRETVLPVRDNETCNAVGLEPFLGDTKVCAGFVDGATGVCHGDSGGPLVVRSPRYGGGWEQIGIVSHGIALGGSCQGYGVFTRVSRYVSWIRGYTHPVH